MTSNKRVHVRCSVKFDRLLHPVIYIFLIITMALIVHLLPAWLLLTCYSLVYLLSSHLCRRSANKLIWRMRWLWVSIFFVMALNTPGEYVASLPWSFAPTYEGLAQGLWQISRLALMLVLIAWMSSCLNRPQLLSAFYTVSQPFKLFRISPQRIAARLWLTMDYIENYHQYHSKKSLLSSFINDGILMTKTSAHEHFVLSEINLSAFDWLIVALMLMSIVLSQLGI
jgi:hypothetical protein